MSEGHDNGLDIATLQRYVDANDDLHDALGIERETSLVLRPLAQGEYNVNFSFDAPAEETGASRPLLLRENTGSQLHLSHQIEYEFSALGALVPSGRTPRPLYVDGSRARIPWGVGVEQRLPGRSLCYETDRSIAADILADIHAVEAPKETSLIAPEHPVADIARECASMYATYRGWSAADSRVSTRIERLFTCVSDAVDHDLARPVLPRGMRHIVNTELNSSNFLINDAARDASSHSYLIDWEKPILGEAEQDIAHFIVPTTTFWKTDTILTRTEAYAFVDAYEAAVDGRFDTSGLRSRLKDYIAVTCLRGITWCSMAMVEYSRPGRAVTNADTFAKIKAYLSPEFLDFVMRDYCES